MSTTKFMCLDIETTGLNPFRHEVIEVGYVLAERDDDGPMVRTEDVEFSLPFSESLASPKALEVNGWGTRQFAPIEDPRVAATRFCEHAVDRFIVASPILFDMAFMWRFIDAHGEAASWSHRRLIDLKSLVAGYRCTIGPFSHSDIAGWINVPESSDKHTALVDADWNFRVLSELTRGFPFTP